MNLKEVIKPAAILFVICVAVSVLMGLSLSRQMFRPIAQLRGAIGATARPRAWEPTPKRKASGTSTSSLWKIMWAASKW